MAAFAEPAAGEQITDHALVQAARRLHVEVLEAGGLTQARLSQTGEQGRVGAIGRLAVDQQGELVGKIQLAAIGEALQLQLSLFSAQLELFAEQTREMQRQFARTYLAPLAIRGAHGPSVGKTV